MVLPQRITGHLASARITALHQHTFNHPKGSPDSTKACAILADHGIPLGKACSSQGK